MPTPRYMTHCAASRPKFNDPGQRREVTAKLPCTLRDQQSDAGAPRAITPKREAMWRNFGGSQAALITGHAVNAHSGNVKPILAPKTLAESSSSRTNSPSRSLNASGGSIYYPNNNNNDASLNSSNTLQQRRLSSGSMNNTVNPNSRFVSVSRSQYQNPAMRSSTPPPMRSSDLLNSSINSNTNKSHWSKNPTSTRLIPVEKNSATIESRADSIVRGGTFPHHKNLVFPDEDPSVDTTRNRLWMHRPLKNGQFEATRKRTYNVPTFRSTSDVDNSTSNIGTPTSATAAPQSRVANNTGTSFLNNSTNSSSSANNSQLHFSKRKIPVPTHIEGAGAMITEVEPRPRFMVRPQAHQAFNPPYNETGDLINVAPQEIPQAAKHLGKRHMSPIRVAGTRWEQTEGGWSDQPAPKPSGTKHYGNTTANSKDFPMTDSPPKNGELPKFRPSIVVMSGAPAFVPSSIVSTRQQQRASTPQPRMNNLSPGRRMVHTPRDHDIFGAREVKQPWHPQSEMSSKQPVLTAAPGSVEIKRCRGMGTYSPQRVQPKYSF